MSDTLVSEDIVLMERSTSGWRTELLICSDGTVVVTGQQGFDAAVTRVVVDPQKALDAFTHPYCYLPA